jgi:hypothetical protein
MAEQIGVDVTYESDNGRRVPAHVPMIGSQLMQRCPKWRADSCLRKERTAGYTVDRLELKGCLAAAA